MPNRIIKESICVSEQIDSLTPFEEITFYRLLVNCDDYGCFDAREKVVISRLFPLREVKPADIRKALQKLAATGLIQLYSVGGKPFLMVCKWSEHQRVRVSRHKYPMPTDCDNSPQLAANCGGMPLESESESESISESESESESIVVIGKRKRFQPPTVEDVQAYCDEKGVYGFDAQYFVDYYESRGWMMGKNRVKDWRACVRTWLRNDQKRAEEKAQEYSDIPY